MDLWELVWVLVVVALAAFGMRLSTRKWLMFDAGITFLFAVLIIPFAVQSQQMQTTGMEISGTHGHLTNLYILYCLVPAVAWLLLQGSQDSTCATAVLTARSLGVSLAALITTYGHFYINIFNTKHLVYGVLGNALWAAVNVYHLIQTGSYNKRGVPSSVDLYLKIDVFFSLGYALPDLLVPDSILALAGLQPDELHCHLLQVGAAVHLGSAVLPWMGQRCLSVHEKKAILYSRIAIMLLLWAIITYSYMFVQATSFFSYFLSCTACLPFFPAYLGVRQTD